MAVAKASRNLSLMEPESETGAAVEAVGALCSALVADSVEGAVFVDSSSTIKTDLNFFRKSLMLEWVAHPYKCGTKVDRQRYDKSISSATVREIQTKKGN
jgi:hypothetical protein